MEGRLSKLTAGSNKMHQQILEASLKLRPGMPFTILIDESNRKPLTLARAVWFRGVPSHLTLQSLHANGMRISTKGGIRQRPKELRVR